MLEMMLEIMFLIAAIVIAALDFSHPLSDRNTEK